MTHPKVKAAIEASEAAKAKASQAATWAARMDELTSFLSRLRAYPIVDRVETVGVSYLVPSGIGKAMSALLQDAYEVELSTLREKLEAL